MLRINVELRKYAKIVPIKKTKGYQEIEQHKDYLRTISIIKLRMNLIYKLFYFIIEDYLIVIIYGKIIFIQQMKIVNFGL